ncbi:hypothetical protein [Actinomadura yumaensis]|uniref:Uncharacterized protein n=1 Tax=Actinomadura yumaensis TaxID=111807 RepID=A0ABW2CNP8_9ACTN
MIDEDDEQEELAVGRCAKCGARGGFQLVQQVQLVADIKGFRPGEGDDQEVAVALDETEYQADCLNDWVECGTCGTAVAIDGWEWNG